MKTDKLLFGFCIILIIIFTIGSAPILFEKINKGIGELNEVMFKNIYIEKDELQDYENCQWKWTLSVEMDSRW